MKDKEKAIILVFLAIIGSVVGLLYWIALQAPPVVLRLWVPFSVFTVALSFVIGWRLGTRDARAHISGLDKGLGTMEKATAGAAKLQRVGGRVVHVSDTPVMSLPDPQVHTARPSEGEIIEL